MRSFLHQPSSMEAKLPIEYSLQETLSIYTKRLLVFLGIAVINILVFLTIIMLQQLLTWFAALQIAKLFLSLAILTFILYLIYMRSNPVRGYLRVSDEDLPINLYSGWRTTKKRFRLLDPERGVLNVVLTARYNSILDKRIIIHIQLRDEFRNIIFEKNIVENASTSLPNGSVVTYQRKAG